MLKKIINKIYLKINPNKFYRKLGVKIGSNVEIYSGVSFGSEPYLIEIGNDVRISANTMFFTHDGCVHVLRNKFNEPELDRFGKIKVGNNVNIGIGVMILPGVTIGNNCAIGCGAVVTKDIPDNSVAAGVPAKVIETIDEYYRKVKPKCDNTKLMTSKGKKDYLLKKYN